MARNQALTRPFGSQEAIRPYGYGVRHAEISFHDR